MPFAFSIFCGSVVAVYVGNVFAKPTSCWAGSNQFNLTFFQEWNCSAVPGNEFCFTVVFTDPAVIKEKQLSIGKGCDDATRCTKNGMTKLVDRNIYCCDTDYCNDVVCDSKGECAEPTDTTTMSPVQTTTKDAHSTSTKLRISPYCVAFSMVETSKISYTRLSFRVRVRV